MPDPGGAAQEAMLAILDPLTLALETDPGFAGIHIDPLAGIIDIATTSDAKDIEPKLVPFRANNIGFRVTKVDFTLAELSELQATVERDLDSWRGLGIKITSIGVDVRTNRVVVTLANLSVDTSPLLTKYGPGLVVSPSEEVIRTAACVSRSNCADPIKAGLSIQDYYGAACTSGFVSKDKAWPGAYYLMTAGHCLDVNGLGVDWLHNGSTFGSASSAFYYNGTNADAGYVLLSVVANPGNQLFVTPTTIRSVTTYASNSGQPQGAWVCRSGATSNWTCGQIVLTNVTTVDTST
jgi:hypothetical protein